MESLVMNIGQPMPPYSLPQIPIAGSVHVSCDDPAMALHMALVGFPVCSSKAIHAGLMVLSQRSVATSRSSLLRFTPHANVSVQLRPWTHAKLTFDVMVGFSSADLSPSLHITTAQMSASHIIATLQ